MIRLLIYLIMVCSLSITGTLMFYSYNLSSGERREMSDQVSRLHEQTLQRLRQTFNQIDYMARNVGNDYVIQRLTEGQAARDSAEERSMRDYADMLIKQQTSQLPYITDVCITVSDNPFILCTNSDAASSLLDTQRLIMQRQDRLIVPRVNEGAASSPYEVIFVSPLVDRKTNVVRGSIQFMVSLDSIMKDIYGKWPLTRHQLMNSDGDVMYLRIPPGGPGKPNDSDWKWSETSQLQWKDDTVISQQSVDLQGTLWISRIEAPQVLEKAHSTTVQLTVLLATFILLLLGIVSTYLFKHYLTKPMDQLRRLMNRAELGDFKAYWVSKTSKEWSELGESYNQMLNRLEELIKQVKREEALKKEAEMEALQYQLNPHFLYNTLNTIKWVAKMHQTPQIAEVVTSLVRLLQASLGKKGDFITIREEIGLIHDYMEIQSFRYGDQVQLECSIDPMANQCLVPRMILQPLVENAIIHGIEPGRRSGCIVIRIWLDVPRDLLYCQVEDNGVGMARESWDNEASAASVRERMSGIGLRHIREKIKLYYGEGYSMQMMSKAREGTTIRLTMPVHQSEVG
ncbi:sensor histidine kinase [Paenibacillus sp. H1-7]|uniref:sensor histidine kinase n=1 Tax=Paenibacillus sp. H1-7 TaxID=2282849 RepID=UPI001EF9A71F|nr:sensor histidine kinase [Paenibacillus sp. H1-7]ULL15771.1 sensor histidine kinase [Paenibacillus sp. H1-7]